MLLPALKAGTLDAGLLICLYGFVGCDLYRAAHVHELQVIKPMVELSPLKRYSVYSYQILPSTAAAESLVNSVAAAQSNLPLLAIPFQSQILWGNEYFMHILS